jgi:hypothetical protein
MKLSWKNVIPTFVLVFAVGCGGGGSSCPDDTPLSCSGGTCCPRGYPYSCGNGYCYQYGCPAGSPDVNLCEFKVATKSAEKQAEAVPVIDEEQAKMCVPEGYPVEDPSQQDTQNQ